MATLTGCSITTSARRVRLRAVTRALVRTYPKPAVICVGRKSDNAICESVCLSFVLDALVRKVTRCREGFAMVPKQTALSATYVVVLHGHVAVQRFAFL